MPFLVPIFDKQTTDLQNYLYRQAQYQGISVDAPKPAYRWAYRPEMQYSLYDLMIDEIRLESSIDGTQMEMDYELGTNSTDPLALLSSDPTLGWLTGPNRRLR